MLKSRMAIGLLVACLCVLPVERSSSGTALRADLPNRRYVAAVASDSVPAAPAPQGTLTIAARQFESWDPHFSDFGQDISHFYMLNRGLYMLDLQGHPQPELAAGLPTVSADGKVYTVTLKGGVRWSDGAPLTAVQFVADLQRTCNPDIQGHYEFVFADTLAGCAAYAAAGGEAPERKEALRAAVGVTALDSQTVRFTLLAPRPTFTTLLALWPAFPTPTQRVAKVDDPWPGPMSAPVLGPFMVSAYTEKSAMVLVPNPNWSGAEKPKVATIVLRYIDDAAESLQAYRDGQLDAISISSAQLPGVRADASLSAEFEEFAAIRTTGLQFNQRPGKPFAALETRLALSQAINRDDLNHVVFGGAQVATTLWMPPERSGLDVRAFQADIGFDLTKARANLAAGSPGGLAFTLLLSDSELNRALGAYLRDTWKHNLGIDVTLSFVESATRTAKYNSGDFDMTVGGWQEDYPDPENWYVSLRERGGMQNRERCGSAEIDALISAAKTTSNDAERRQTYVNAEMLTVRSLQCNAPLFHNAGLRLVKPYIGGMRENGRAGDVFARGDWNPERWTTSKR